MDVKSFRGTIYELEESLDEFFRDIHPVKINNFQMFPIDKTFETELCEDI